MLHSFLTCNEINCFKIMFSPELFLSPEQEISSCLNICDMTPPLIVELLYHCLPGRHFPTPSILVTLLLIKPASLALKI